MISTGIEMFEKVRIYFTIYLNCVPNTLSIIVSGFNN